MNDKMNKKRKVNKFDPGIYNYCDRWCKKCSKTEKCYLYCREQENRQELIEKGLDPDDFKNAFSMIEKELTEVKNQLDDLCKKHNIDTSDLGDEEERDQIVDKQIAKNKVNKVANQFCKDLSNWLGTRPPLYYNEYKDAYENVAWHGPLMATKIYRSLVGKYEAKLEKGEIREASKDDSKKSAYVAYRSALISLEALDLMDSRIVDFRIGKMIKQVKSVIKGIEKELLQQD